jgi:hypothetical protein
MTGFSKIIESIEELGQTSLSFSNLLPKDSSDEEWELLESLGVKKLKSDDLFWCVELPEGWSIIPSENHSLYSHLVDTSGFRRAEIFYKAVSYDRVAKMSVFKNRIRIEVYMDEVNIKDCGLEQIIGPIQIGTYGLVEEDFGFIIGDIFYYTPESSSDKTVFTAECSSFVATPWTKEAFKAERQKAIGEDRKTMYKVTSASKTIQEKVARAWIEANLPSGNHQWTHEFTEALATVQEGLGR